MKSWLMVRFWTLGWVIVFLSTPDDFGTQRSYIDSVFDLILMREASFGSRVMRVERETL